MAFAEYADAASGQALELLRVADLVAMNEDEASAWISCPFEPDCPERFLARCADSLSVQRRPVALLVSAGPHGAFAFDGTVWEHRAAPAVPVASIAGARDALLAGALSALAVGMPLTAAGTPGAAADGSNPLQSTLSFAVLLASFTVTSPHSIHPDSIHPECCLERLLGYASAQALDRPRELARKA